MSARAVLMTMVVVLVVVACQGIRRELRYDDVVAPVQPPPPSTMPSRADIVGTRFPLPHHSPAWTGDDVDARFLRGEKDVPLAVHACVRADALRDAAGIADHCIPLLVARAEDQTQVRSFDATVAMAVLLRGIGLGSAVQSTLIAALARVDTACERGCAQMPQWARFRQAALERLDQPGSDEPPAMHHQVRVTADEQDAVEVWSDVRGHITLPFDGLQTIELTVAAGDWVWWEYGTTVVVNGDASVANDGMLSVSSSGRLALTTSRSLRLFVADASGQARQVRTEPREAAPTRANVNRVETVETTERLLGAGADMRSSAAVMQLTQRLVFARAQLSDEDPQDLARQLLANAGTTPLTMALAIDVLEDDDAVGGAERNALLAPLRALLLEQLPQHPATLLALAREALGVSARDAEPLLCELVQVAPAYVVGWRQWIEVLMDLHRHDEAEVAIEQMLARDETRATLQAASQWMEQLGNAARATQLQRAGASNRQRFFQDVAAGHASQPPPQLVDQQQDPWSGQQVAAQWFQNRTNARDNAWLRAQRNPRSEDALLASWLWLDDSARRAQLAQAPMGQRTLRWQEAHGVTLWTAFNARTKEVLAQRQQNAPPLPEEPLVRLLRARSAQFDERGSARLIEHELIEVRSKEAIDAVGQRRHDDEDHVIHWRVHKPDGRVLRAEQPEGIVDWALPGLAPGDVVELLHVLHRERRPNATIDLQWPWHDAAATLVDEVRVTWPCQDRQFDVQVTDELKPAAGADSCAVTLSRGARGRRRLQPFSVADQAPSVRIEVKPKRQRPQLAQAAHARASQLRANLIPDPWLRDVASHIVHAPQKVVRTPAQVQRDAVHRLAAWVEREIRPGTSMRPAQTVLTGAGDRFALMLALLHASDIPFALVGLHQAARGDWHNDPYAFGQLAAWVQGELLVAEDVLFTINQLPSSFEGAWMMPLEPAAGAPPPSITDVGAWVERLGLSADSASFDPTNPMPVPLPVTSLARAPSTLRIDLSLVGSELQGVVVAVPDGLAGDWLRAQLRDAQPDDLVRALEQLLQPHLPGVQVDEVIAPAMQRADEPFALGCRVRVPVAADDEVRFEHLFSQGAMAAMRADVPLAAFHVPERSLQMFLPASHEVLELQLRLPSRATFTYVPPALDNVGRVRVLQNAYVEDGRLLWRRELVREASLVPASEWPQVQAELVRSAGELDASIAFVVDRQAAATQASANGVPPP
jgi:hypothetical protein